MIFFNSSIDKSDTLVKDIISGSPFTALPFYHASDVGDRRIESGGQIIETGIYRSLETLPFDFITL